MKKALFAAVALASAASAQAAVVTIDFESTPSVLGTISGATFSNGFTFGCGGGCPAPATGHFGSADGTVGTMTVNFATLQNWVSFVNVSFSGVLVTAYDSSSTILASLSDTQGFPITGSTLTLSAPGIKYVTFENLPGIGFGIDNLSFNAVPEPASWALMIVGFGMVGVSMRRRPVVEAAAL